MTHMQQLKEKAENKPPMVAETSNLESLTNNLLKAISGRLRIHKHKDLPPLAVRLHQGEDKCEGDSSSAEGKEGAEASLFVSPSRNAPPAASAPVTMARIWVPSHAPIQS